MVSSNEKFNWSSGDTWTANWTLTDTSNGEEVKRGTISVTLSNIPQNENDYLGIISYNGKLYLLANKDISYFTFSVSGCYDTTADGEYTEQNCQKYETEKGVLFESPKNNGILYLADNNNSLPYVITGGFELTSQQIFDFWYNRINQGAQSTGSVAEGYATVAGTVDTATSRIGDIVYEAGLGAYAEGVRSVATAPGSHAGGAESEATGFASFTHGYKDSAEGIASMAVGARTRATGKASFSEGLQTRAEGEGAHAAGQDTAAKGDYSYAGGLHSIATGKASHAEGEQAQAYGDYSVAIGAHVVASGEGSVAMGLYNESNGRASVAQGEYLLTPGRWQAAVGRYNEPGLLQADGTSNILFAVGDGTAGDKRHNAFSVGTDGLTFNDTAGINHTLSIVHNQLLLDGQGIQTTNTDSGYYISEVRRIDDFKYALTVSNALNPGFSLTNNYSVSVDSSGAWVKLTNLVNGTDVTFIDVGFKGFDADLPPAEEEDF